MHFIDRVTDRLARSRDGGRPAVSSRLRPIFFKFLRCPLPAFGVFPTGDHFIALRCAGRSTGKLVGFRLSQRWEFRSATGTAMLSLIQIAREDAEPVPRSVSDLGGVDLCLAVVFPMDRPPRPGRSAMVGSRS
jgi:hypothetical protein